MKIDKIVIEDQNLLEKVNSDKYLTLIPVFKWFKKFKKKKDKRWSHVQDDLQHWQLIKHSRTLHLDQKRVLISAITEIVGINKELIRNILQKQNIC